MDSHVEQKEIEMEDNGRRYLNRFNLTKTVYLLTISKKHPNEMRANEQKCAWLYSLRLQ